MLNKHLLKFASDKAANFPMSNVGAPSVQQPQAPAIPPTTMPNMQPSPQPPAPYNAQPVGQSSQTPPVTTSSGAANTPPPVQGAAARAPGLIGHK